MLIKFTYVKDPFEAKYQFKINKQESIGKTLQ